MQARKLAVVLLNLGGPDKQEAVKPFLFNLFNDEAIMRVPQPLRWMIATILSQQRTSITKKIYLQIGGGSPLLFFTEEQSKALKETLSIKVSETDVQIFIAMRYWNPFAAETVHMVKMWAPDEVILLPLYPQYSTTTTASSLKDWNKAAKAAKLHTPTKTVFFYPTESGFIDAHVLLLRSAITRFIRYDEFRILFSAHGLPKRIIDAGDPYRTQVEATCTAVMTSIGKGLFDYVVCFQSRVGPLEWIGPETTQEIKRAGYEGKSIIIVPISFVSEHSETLVELDKEYADLALNCGVPCYVRVAALGTHPSFIGGLANLVIAARANNDL